MLFESDLGGFVVVWENAAADDVEGVEGSPMVAWQRGNIADSLRDWRVRRSTNS
jgi:hypothetical protein